MNYNKRNRNEGSPGSDQQSFALFRVCMWILFIIFEFLFWGAFEKIASPTASSSQPLYSNVSNPDKVPYWDELEHLLNLDSVTEDQWDQRHLPEPTYPRKTVSQDFDTRAVRMEVAKHDRMILEGLHFIHRLRNQNYHALRKLRPPFGTSDSPRPKICISISVCNRRIPYIYALLMSLFQHDITKYPYSSTLLPLAQINLLNTEKRLEEQILHPNTPHQQSFAENFNQTLANLPFIHNTYDLTQYDPILDEIARQRPLTYHEITISDHLMALKTCVESGAPWCLLMEEDALVSPDFFESLHEFILQPLENKRASLSLVSLYAYYNLVFKGDERLTNPKYSKLFYEQDRGRGPMHHLFWDSTRNTTKDISYQTPKYTVSNREYKYGAVANLYTLESVRKLIVYLEEIIVDTPEHNADEFINAAEHFPLASGAPRKQVDPSLVNHIGFYSERMMAVQERGMFSQLNTDVRF